MVKSRWKFIGRSVVGASHLRTEMPNQDAMAWRHVDPETEESLVVAVSDGHGSARSFRSDRGAKFAAETTLEILVEFLGTHGDSAKSSSVKRIAEERLPRDVWISWRDRVKADLEAEPFSETETGIVGDNEPFLAYGATVLAACITPAFLLYFQLGDGDILAVTGGEEERPLPADERLLGNETTSLCTGNAWRDFRFRFQQIVDTAPELILLSTDGYANSFLDDASFRKTARDIREMIRMDGIEIVESHLESWLREASDSGSGDDISVALLCNLSAFAEVKKSAVPPDRVFEGEHP